MAASKAARRRVRELAAAQTSGSNGVLARGKLLGKYRLVRRMAKGGYGEIWRAQDTIEDVPVALKLPLPEPDEAALTSVLLREIRTIVRLRHPHIIPVRNADIIQGRLVLVTELASGSLDELPKPLSVQRSISIAAQVLAAMAHAHRHRVIHRDVTPGNIFLFPGGHVALGDFGIAKEFSGRADTTVNIGTQGYAAPEQMFGRPSYASDCFSVGLVLYECLTGALPKWPFKWPLRRSSLLARRVAPAIVQFLRRALEVDEHRRFANAKVMVEVLAVAAPENMPRGASEPSNRAVSNDWRRVRRETFLARYGRILELDYRCANCGEPIAEPMQNCPWCGYARNSFAAITAYPLICTGCDRGVLAEWRFCPWCYGSGFTNPESGSRRGRAYREDCRRCRGGLMRFMKYCPWCRAKVRTRWHVWPFPEVCGRCHWSVDSSFWRYCPWCRLKLED